MVGGGQRRLLRLGSYAVGLMGLVIGSLGIFDQVRIQLWCRQLRSADAAARQRACDEIARLRERRAADAILALLASESNREVLEAAAYAALRAGDERAIGVLQRRAQTRPDDHARAKMIISAARLAAGDTRLVPALEAGLRPGEPWRLVGSAIGLLELRVPRGGKALIEHGPTLQGEVAGFAVDEFRRIARPMAEAVGQPIADWPEPGDPAGVSFGWDRLRTFWARYGDAPLLTSILTRIERGDPDWFEVNRLLHARPQVARWLE